MIVNRRTAIRTVGQLAAGLAITRQPAPARPPQAPDGCSGDDVPGFTRRCFTDTQDVTHVFYDTESDGPPVLVLHELPGLVPPDLDAGRRLKDAGYRVVMPLFFGRAGEPSGFWRTLRYTRRHCNEREFACGEADVTSPHVRWLGELATKVYAERKVGHGVGVVGMCLTGAFPVALLTATVVKAAVACQPTVPFNVGTYLGLFTKKSGLGIHPADLETARTASTAPILGIRYANDPLCTNARFRRLTDEFGARFYRMDLTGSGHSTLGKHLCAIADDEVKRFLNATLRESPRTDVGSFPFASRPNARDEIWVSCGHHV